MKGLYIEKNDSTVLFCTRLYMCNVYIATYQHHLEDCSCTVILQFDLITDI